MKREVTLRLRGLLPALLTREMREGEEFSFPVTARVEREEFDVETGDTFVDLRIVSARKPS